MENITCNPSVRDILQTAADEILETEQFQPNKSTLEVQGVFRKYKIIRLIHNYTIFMFDGIKKVWFITF